LERFAVRLDTRGLSSTSLQAFASSAADGRRPVRFPYNIDFVGHFIFPGATMDGLDFIQKTTGDLP
jgi:hypothetical protein